MYVNLVVSVIARCTGKYLPVSQKVETLSCMDYDYFLPGSYDCSVASKLALASHLNCSSKQATWLSS